jgi:hypothetical protein
VGRVELSPQLLRAEIALRAVIADAVDDGFVMKTTAENAG